MDCMIMICLRKKPNAWNSAPAPACAYVCVHTPGKGGAGRAGRVVTVGCAAVRTGVQVPGLLPQAGSWHALVMGFTGSHSTYIYPTGHRHQTIHSRDLSHGAPTPDHTQQGSVPRGTNTRPQTQDSTSTKPSPREGSADLPAASLPGRGLQLLERFSNLHGTLSPLFSYQRTKGYPTLPLGVPWILMKTQQRAQKGEAAGNLFA